MRARRHRAALLLLPAGMLAAHSLGWLAADPSGRGGHHALTGQSHLVVLAALAGVLGLAGLVAAARDGYRGRRVPASVVTVVGGQAICFVALEATEAFASGAGVATVLGQPALWAGLLLQVAVAYAVRTLVRTSAAAGSALRRSPLPARPPTTGRGPPAVVA